MVKFRTTQSSSFGDREIDFLNDYVYLGTTFNYNGLFNKAICKQIIQARQAMYNLIAKAKKLYLPVDIQCELFDQLVTPILLYGSETWGLLLGKSTLKYSLEGSSKACSNSLRILRII